MEVKEDVRVSRCAGCCGRSEVIPESFPACVDACLACVIAHIVLIEVLCYLASARNRDPKDDIIKKCPDFLG